MLASQWRGLAGSAAGPGGHCGGGGGLLMGKRPPVTARLEPGPTVKTFVTIIPFPSQSRFRRVKGLLTRDEEPGFVSVERSDTYVLWNLKAKASHLIDATSLLPEIVV